MTSPSAAKLTAIPAALLRRQGLVFVPAGAAAQPELVLQAFDLELAALGFVASTRLRTALARLDDDALSRVQQEVCAALAAQLGADRKHEPLFRKFPHGIPSDTAALWWTKVISHFLQAPDQPCLFCRRTGTTHVLRPCTHVVCDYCFDGSNYSACPVCEHHVDRSSPFFEPTPVQPRAERAEQVRYKLLDDVQSNQMHWIDAYSAGQFQFNNVASSNQAITRICPELIAYFASGVRMTMHELALLHAAARARRVILRGQEIVVIDRGRDEDAAQFLARLRGGIDAQRSAGLPPIDHAAALASCTAATSSWQKAAAHMRSSASAQLPRSRRATCWPEPSYTAAGGTRRSPRDRSGGRRS